MQNVEEKCRCSKEQLIKQKKYGFYEATSVGLPYDPKKPTAYEIYRQQVKNRTSQ